MNRMNYAEIKDRAIELLKSGVIDNRSFDEIRHGESCIRAWCIRDALDRACREIEQQLPPPHHHRCVTLRKSDCRKAEGEIKRHLRDWNNDQGRCLLTRTCKPSKHHKLVKTWEHVEDVQQQS